MRKIRLLLIIAGICTVSLSTVNAQAPKQANPKAQVPKLKMCTLPTDSSASTKVTLLQAQEWADNLPLKVVCNDGKIYELSQFIFTMITMKPLQTKEFGLANNGIPILARKAINEMKQGDTILLKEVAGKDAAGKEIKLPNIVFVVKE